MARGFGATLGVSTSDIIRGISFPTPVVFSFAGWFLRNGAGGLGNGRIFDKEGSAPGDIILRNSNSTSSITTSKGFSTTSGVWQTTDAEAVATAKYIHIAEVYDASSTSNVPIIYINGRPVTVTTVTAPVGTANTGNSGTLSIGNRSTLGVDWDGAFGGKMAMWGGVMLTQGEVMALYRGADPRRIHGEALLECYDFGAQVPVSLKYGVRATMTGTRPFREPLRAPEKPLWSAVGGTAYNVTISVTNSAAAGLQKGVGLVRSITNAPAASLSRPAALARSIAVSASSVMSLATLKAKGVVISVTQSSAVTQLRGVGLVRSITNAPSASVARVASLARSITVSGASSVSMTRSRALQATISVTRATSVTLATLKAKGVLISVTNAPAVSLAQLRAFSRSISVAGTTAVSLLRPANLKRTLSFASSVSVLLSWLRPEAGTGASRILRIPAEIRRLVVKAEVRTLSIERENRTVAVKSEKN